MIEEWKTIEGFEDYQVSNFGRVKSLKRNKERILKFGNNNQGYLYVELYKNGKSKILRIHRLILKTFKPIFNSDNLECNHIDGNKLNNYADNLEWSTRSENELHAYRIGLKNSEGENGSGHKLSNKEITEIRNLLREQNLIQREIAKIFNICQETVSMINSRRKWKYI